MPYVAMAELKWSIPGRKGSLVVPAGDEVGGPVPPRAIQRGVVAFLPNVSGRTWKERMAEEFPGEIPPAVEGDWVFPPGVGVEAPDAPPGYVKHGDELIKAPRTAQKLTGPPPPKPPTVDEILKAGYSAEAAEAIFAEEQEKAAKGYPPYGDNEPPTPDLPEVDPHEAAALGLLSDEAPEPQETAEGDEEKPGLLSRIFGSGDDKTEVAGQPGAEREAPAAHDAPADLASPETPEPASDKSSKGEGRGSRRKG